MLRSWISIFLGLPDPDPLVRGKDPEILVAIMKFIDENSRIRRRIPSRNWFRIRIRYSEVLVRIRGSGFVPKCLGSAKLPLTWYYGNKNEGHDYIIICLALNRQFRMKCTVFPAQESEIGLHFLLFLLAVQCFRLWTRKQSCHQLDMVLGSGTE